MSRYWFHNRQRELLHLSIFSSLPVIKFISEARACKLLLPRLTMRMMKAIIKTPNVACLQSINTHESFLSSNRLPNKAMEGERKERVSKWSQFAFKLPDNLKAPPRKNKTRVLFSDIFLSILGSSKKKHITRRENKRIYRLASTEPPTRNEKDTKIFKLRGRRRRFVRGFR